MTVVPYRMTFNRWILCLAVCCSAQGVLAADAASPAAKAGEKPEYFATVGGQKIPLVDYTAMLQANSRNRFYHGKAPEQDVEQFKKETAEQLVNRVLLLQEAARLKLAPEAKEVDARLAKQDEKRKKDEYWQQNRERLLPLLRKQLEDESRLEVLERRTKNVAKPSAEALKTFYKNNPDKFTAPEQIKVSTIILKVDPSSPESVWKAAVDEASGIVGKLRGGAKFDDMARIHSGDESAANGGDMGYIHQGMLATPAQNVLNMMSPGDISEPVVLLQGVGIFRLDERVAPRLNSFDKVQDRVESLLQREQGEQAWSKLLERLRKQTKIEINPEIYKITSDAS